MTKKRMAVLIVALALAACSDDEPVGPVDKSIGNPQLIIAIAEEQHDFLPMLDDLVERVLPALNDAKVGGLLSVHTSQLLAQMMARNTAGARAAHDAALATLEEYSARVGADAVDAADIEVVRLTLATAEEMIGQ